MFHSKWMNLAERRQPMKSGGGGGGGGTQTVTNEPWSGQKSYLTNIFGEAKNLYNANGPDYFPNATYVPFSPQSEMAMTLAQNRALQGSPLTQGAKDLTQQTLQGDFLNSNPYLDQMYDNAASSVTRNYREALAPTIDAQFSKAGRYGSGMWANQHDTAQENLGRTLNNLAGDTYGKNYAIERQNQQGLLPFSQQLAQSDYNEIGQLANIGAAVEGKSGEMLNDRINRFNYYQNLPQQKLDAYSRIINGAPAYQNSTQTNTQNGSTTSNVIGGALAGSQFVPWAAEAMAPAGMAVSSAAMPWLGIGGAIGGGLLGLFG